LIIGEATKNEKVVPSGTPAYTKPKNNGTAEQEQKGVIIPKSEAKMLPIYFFSCERIFLIFSGGKNERMIETAKIITNKSKRILIVSKIKKFTASASSVFGIILKTEYVSQSAKSWIG